MAKKKKDFQFVGASARQEIKDHIKFFKNCTSCNLCETRRQTVFFRGHLPCLVLFVGEGPGKSEDFLGIPFIGEAGKLQDEIIAEAISTHWAPYTKKQLTHAFTNLVACMPVNDDGQIRPPKAQEIKACQGQFTDLVETARPKLIVSLGKVATKYVPQLVPDYLRAKSRIVSTVHPSAILRQKEASGVNYKRSLLTLQNAFRELSKIK